MENQTIQTPNYQIDYDKVDIQALNNMVNIIDDTGLNSKQEGEAQPNPQVKTGENLKEKV